LLYFAITAEPETFDAETHCRIDLDVFEVSVSQSESEFALLEIALRNPRAALDGKWIHFSRDGEHIFHGELSVSPRGTVGDVYYVEALGRLPDAGTQMAALAENMKTEPGWDALFASGDDISEVLAGHGKVLAWSRTDGTVSAVDPLSGAKSLTITPLEDTLTVEADDSVPATAALKMEVEWRQLNIAYHNISGRIGSFKTLTHSELTENWPSVGTKIGSDCAVTESAIAEEADRREDIASSYDLGDLALDPAWAVVGFDPRPAQVRTFTPTLNLEQRFEVRRKETCTVTLNAGVQDVIRSDEIEEETIRLNDITERASASAWRPQTDYLEGDQVVDAGRVLQARADHFSGDRLSPSDWSAVGETSYISSRRISSFFKTTRGRAAINHAVARLQARLRYAARSVLVSCQCEIPDLSLLDHDCIATIKSPDLIGGSATGRVVSYSFNWSDGREYASVTIACAAGDGAADDITVGAAEGAVSGAHVRVEVELTNAYEDQIGAYQNGEDVPETVVLITPQSPPAVDFEQEISVPISGSVAIPKQVILT
tara:strand:- start:262 stop:1896 length:1635 start_codon:yes stop_codon:yes gene_type:complete